MNQQQDQISGKDKRRLNSETEKLYNKPIVSKISYKANNLSEEREGTCKESTKKVAIINVETRKIEKDKEVWLNLPEWLVKKI